MFLDETAANTGHGSPLWLGSARRALPDRCARMGTGRPRRSSAGLRTSGPSAVALLDGPVTGERFRAYVAETLAPTLKPATAVILDNLGAHKVAGVREAMAAVGARLLDLPPYSPSSTRSSGLRQAQSPVAQRSGPHRHRSSRRPPARRCALHPKGVPKLPSRPPDVRINSPLYLTETALEGASVVVPELRVPFELCRFQSSRCCYREAMLSRKESRTRRSSWEFSGRSSSASSPV